MQDDSQGDLVNYILKLRGEASDVQEMAQAAAPEQQAAMMRLATKARQLGRPGRAALREADFQKIELRHRSPISR